MYEAKFRKNLKFIKTLALAVLFYLFILVSVPMAHSCDPITDKLDVDAEVGSTHFRGELTEFYIMVSYIGKPINAKISAVLYYNGTMQAELTSLTEHIATGLYRVPYTIPLRAATGTYALMVNASTCALEGTTLTSFLLSPTLTNWNAWIIEVQEDVAIIRTDIAIIRVSLDAANARLVSIDERMATIETDLGTVRTDVRNINLKLTHLDGDIATITTTLGDINGTLVSIRENIANIETDIGSIQVDINAINATLQNINGTMVTIESNVGEMIVSLDEINATLGKMNGTVATILTSVGTIETSTRNIQLRISKIEGNVATISTTLGNIQGTIVSIQEDVATIKTNLGTIKASLSSTQTTGLGTSLALILIVTVATVSLISALMLGRRRRMPIS